MNLTENYTTLAETSQGTESSSQWKTNSGTYDGITWNRYYNFCNSNFKYNNGEYVRGSNNDQPSSIGAIQLIGTESLEFYIYNFCSETPDGGGYGFNIGVLNLIENSIIVINDDNVTSSDESLNYGERY